jgi:hypothetical protein
VGDLARFTLGTLGGLLSTDTTKSIEGRFLHVPSVTADKLAKVLWTLSSTMFPSLERDPDEGFCNE